jgi:hypothetical protein
MNHTLKRNSLTIPRDKFQINRDSITVPRDKFQINRDSMTIPRDRFSIIRDSFKIERKIIGQSILDSIRQFFKSDFFYFMKNYLFFLILFSICFHILLYIQKNTTNKLIIMENKVFFYILIAFLFIIISDILATPVESLKKFIIIIIISLITIYITNHFIEIHYGNHTIMKTLLSTFFIFIIFMIIVYFTFERSDKNVSIQLYNIFNTSFSKNIGYFVFFIIYFFIYLKIFQIFNVNTSITDIIGSSIIGLLLVFFVFFFIIYLCIKLKIINSNSILNTFIVLGSLAIFLGLTYLYIFMNSLSTVCQTEQSVESVNEQEKMILLILLSIFIILWLDDSREWYQMGYIIFLMVSVFVLYCFFYYSVKYPSTSLFSLWLLVEWFIILFYRKQNSKNSIHFAFLKT